MEGRIHQINVSDGGVPKLPIETAVVAEDGLEGDRQEELNVHGGPGRAVCLFALEEIIAFQAEGHVIGPGSAGENVTTEGIDWEQMEPGVRIHLGSEVELEVTNYTIPCKKQARWFSDGDFTRLSQKVNPGHSRVYARVLSGGTIHYGDPITVIPAQVNVVEAVPVLPVADVAASIEHYRAKLGFSEVFRYGDPAEYARISRGSVLVDFVKGTGTAVSLTVNDVDAIAGEMRAAGAEIVFGPETQPWGRREVHVVDPDGHVLNFGADV